MRICFLFCILSVFNYAETVGVVGMGYVGLVLTEVLARCGHQIVCLDLDQEKIDQLNQGILPIFEPGLTSLFSSRVSFSTQIQSLEGVATLFVCVGTPSNERGECDCSAIYEVLAQISQIERPPTLICIKSTIAPGTTKKLEAYLGPSSSIQLVYNPEFTREGTALSDFLMKNPIVLGTRSVEQAKRIHSIYDPLIALHPDLQWIETTPETAELIKYGWNSYSAIRVSYVNELSRLCTHFDGDIEVLMKGIAWSERLLATENIKPGIGYGGPCLPKDSLGLARVFEQAGINSTLIHQALFSNQQHIEAMTKRLENFIGEGSKRIAVFGVAFKANTDDIRQSSAIAMIDSLLKQGHTIQVFDPYALSKVKHKFPQITCYSSPYEAALQANCILILTDNQEFSSLDLEELSLRVSEKKIADFKNVFSLQKMKEAGFEWMNMGRMQ